MKKYYLRHKYLTDFELCQWNYLNLDKELNALLINSRESAEYVQTQFTDDDIENLVQSYGFNLMDWIKEEVN